MATIRNRIQSEKNFRKAGRWPRFPDDIPKRMRGMAMNRGPQLSLNYYSAI